MQRADIAPRSNGATNAGASDRGKIRVVVIDMHPAIQDAVARRIQQRTDMLLSGRASSVTEALQLVAREHPDVAVTELVLTDDLGLNLIQELRAQHEPLRVVIYSMYDENVYAERAIRAGASGYVMKREPTQAVVEAVGQAIRGEVYLSRPMASRLLNRLVRKEGASPGQTIDKLTNREMVVFQLLGEGYSIDRIAERLHLSRKTVEIYRRRAKEKLGFVSTSRLLQFAVQWVQGEESSSRP